MIIEDKPLDDTSPCPINGKYHNVPMAQVPSHFLDWFLGQAHLMRKYPKVTEYIRRNARAIEQDLDEDDSEWNFDEKEWD